MPVYNETTKTGIKKDVKIGIGTFPYVSSSESNKRGYIRIPAAEWGEIGSAQRTKVINLIKSSNFKGTGGLRRQLPMQKQPHICWEQRRVGRIIVELICLKLLIRVWFQARITFLL